MASSALQAALASYGQPRRKSTPQPHYPPGPPGPPTPRPTPMPTHPQTGMLRGQGYPGRRVLNGRLGTYVGTKNPNW